MGLDAALLESLTSETKLTPAVQPGDSDAAPPDDVTTGAAVGGGQLANEGAPAGKPDEDTSFSHTGKNVLRRMSLLSCPRAWWLCGIEHVHLPGHPVTTI